VLALLVVVFLAFELQFQLVVEVTTMGCGSTLTATFVRLALGACQDWKWRQVALYRAIRQIIYWSIERCIDQIQPFGE
jgi:hypothetical protein